MTNNSQRGKQGNEIADGEEKNKQKKETKESKNQ